MKFTNNSTTKHPHTHNPNVQDNAAPYAYSITVKLLVSLELQPVAVLQESVKLPTKLSPTTWLTVNLNDGIWVSHIAPTDLWDKSIKFSLCVQPATVMSEPTCCSSFAISAHFLWKGLSEAPPCYAQNKKSRNRVSSPKSLTSISYTSLSEEKREQPGNFHTVTKHFDIFVAVRKHFQLLCAGTPNMKIFVLC